MLQLCQKSKEKPPKLDQLEKTLQILALVGTGHSKSQNTQVSCIKDLGRSTSLSYTTAELNYLTQYPQLSLPLKICLTNTGAIDAANVKTVRNQTVPVVHTVLT